MGDEHLPEGNESAVPTPAGSSQQPVIHDLQRRRALEEAIGALAQTRSEAELYEEAEAIAAGWPPSMILPVLLKSLDTPSAQLRGGLARLAVLLPRAEVVAALRQQAGNRRLSPQLRMTAAMILERFLHDAVSPGLIADLSTSNDAAMQSLREAVDEGRSNRHVLLEYVTQMQQHGEEIAHLVMEHLDSLPAPDRVELLRLIAQDGRPRVAEAARNRLVRLAGEESGALRALYTLQWTLPPEQASSVERELRKLQFRGKPYTPPAPAGWRALLAPAEPGGQMWVWLVRMPTARQRGLLAGLLLHAEAGILHSFVADPMDDAYLPSPAPIGALVDIPLEETAGGRFLEAPFDLGRLLLRRALRPHWEGRARRPVSGEVHLANDLFWQFAPPVVDPALTALLDQPAAPLTSDEAVPLVELLLQEPAMATWTLPAAASLRTAALRMPDLGAATEDVARLIVRELAQGPGRDEMLGAVAAGLRQQALWLHVAGHFDTALAARRLSASMQTLPPQQNPLLLAMVTAAVQRLPGGYR